MKKIKVEYLSGCHTGLIRIGNSFEHLMSGTELNTSEVLILTDAATNGVAGAGGAEGD